MDVPTDLPSQAGGEEKEEEEGRGRGERKEKESKQEQEAGERGTGRQEE